MGEGTKKVLRVQGPWGRPGRGAPKKPQAPAASWPPSQGSVHCPPGSCQGEP